MRSWWKCFLGRAFKALQIWPHFSYPITAASIPPARTPSANQGSLHAILGAQQIHSSLVPLPMLLPTPLPGVPSLLYILSSAQAPRHSSSRSLSGSLAAKAPPVSQRNTCNTTWRLSSFGQELVLCSHLKPPQPETAHRSPSCHSCLESFAGSE